MIIHRSLKDLMIISVVCFLKRSRSFLFGVFSLYRFFVKLKLKIFQTLPDVLGVKFFCLVFFVVPFFVELKLKFLRHCRTYSV